MKKVIALNGSPKKVGSASSAIIEILEKIMDHSILSYQPIHLTTEESYQEAFKEISKHDILVVVSPIYVDSLPSPILRFLHQFEKWLKETQQTRPAILGICHCGFHEASQCQYGLKILEKFAQRLNLRWIGGVQFGGSPMIGNFSGRGRNEKIFQKAQAQFEKIKISLLDSADTKINLSINGLIPKFMYLCGGNIGWHYMAYQNKVLTKLWDKPYLIKEGKR